VAISDDLVFVSPDEYAWIEQHQDGLQEWLGDMESRDDSEFWMISAAYLGALEAMLDWVRLTDGDLADTCDMIRIKSCAVQAQNLADRVPGK